MPVDPRIPGISLKEGEKVVFIARWHWIYVFLQLSNIFIIPLIVRILQWKNAVYVLTNKRVIEQSGVISKDQRSIELGKIQNVNSGTKGIIQRLTGIGYVHVETSGRASDCWIWGAPKARELSDQIISKMDDFKKEEQIELAKAIAKGMKEGTQQEKTKKE